MDMEVVLAILFLGYFMYAEYIKYCLIAMIAQIIVSFFIEKKQIWKVAPLIFITQGIVVSIADITYDMINSIYRYKSLGFWSVIRSESFKFDIFYTLILIAIIIIIGFFTYRSIEGKMNYKKWLALLIGYLINILIMLFMIWRFGIIVGGF